MNFCFQAISPCAGPRQLRRSGFRTTYGNIGAAGFFSLENNMADELGSILLVLARNAIARQLHQPLQPVAEHPALADRGATFVTLTQAGELRGCIGSLEAHRDLKDDVEHNARAAAFADPRFPPLTAAEFGRTRVEVSLLTRPEFVEFKDEADALSKLRPNVDGVIFFSGCRRSTFLPQVWETLPEPKLFMAHLKQKAGVAPDFWGSNVMLATYQVQKWREAGAA